MADTKISAYPAVSSIDGTQEYPINDAGTTKKATGTQQAQYTESRLQQGVVCSHATDTTLTTITWTALPLDTERFKVGDSSIHSTVTNNSRLTAQIAGEYVVTVSVPFDGVGSDIVLRARVVKNGSTTIWKATGPSYNGVSFQTILNGAPIIQLSASDYIELEAYHNLGSDLDVIGADLRFGMYLLGR